MRTTFQLTALWLAILTLLTPSLSGQESKSRDVDTLNTNGRLKQMAAAVALTDEQKEKVRPIILEEVKGVRLLREDEKLSMDDRFKKEEQLRVAYKEKLKGVLTAEQFQKWEAFNKKAPKKPSKKP